ncbi:MAG: T9SS type A sorting domain-containing protein [Paludibacter sp.]|nr:T9SS type A sorting domain-containing protein [Paludibacter sp.]
MHKKTLFLFTIIFLNFSVIFAQYNDPNIPKPTTGYGSDGTHSIGKISFTNPNFTSKNIEIYYPVDVQEPVPTIFYSHAYGGNNSENISGMLNFVAQKGYAIVFVPYQTVGVTVEERYTNLLNGFRMAARDYPSVIDTTRVGFMGHSFGGGASFGLAHQCFTENNWGSNGRFIYALAQWYSYNLDDNDLVSFPADTKVLIEVFDDDTINDHRMAIDVFDHINIDSNEKDYISLKSDTINGYIYSAEHNVPSTSVAFDALDYYAYYRFIDALADYTFNKNKTAKATALGNGSSEQTTMPVGLKSLTVTNQPTTSYSESKYVFPCSSQENPRKDHCAETTEINEIQLPEKLTVKPNPASNYITISFTNSEMPHFMRICNLSGETIFQQKTNLTSPQSVNISTFTPGIYFITYNEKRVKFIKR